MSENQDRDIAQDVNYLYTDRENFCVVALTGYTASGCSRLAEYMAHSGFYNDNNVVRPPESISLPNISSTDNDELFFKNQEQEARSAAALEIFRRKYTICYNFIKRNYKPFTVIKYSKVLWVMALRLMAEKAGKGGELKNLIRDLLVDRFRASTDPELDKDYIDLCEKTGWQIPDYPDLPIDYDNLLSSLKELNHELEDQKVSAALARIFTPTTVEEPISDFFVEINKWLFAMDYYKACFFYHRLGRHLRKGLDIKIKSDEEFKINSNVDSTYDVVKFITKIIQSLRQPNEGEKEKRECRVVIDSIRTSLEARYLKERYSGFYLIAVHDEEGNAQKHLKEKILHNYENRTLFDYKWDEDEIKRVSQILEKQVSKVLYLGGVERKNDDFENGKFSAPNVSQCVADAEIHISNNENLDVSKPYFRTMGEQWLKYASLIFHPGLITPSAEERCMVVAYTAKFNSGCLSRQVGAVITNKSHSIRTIGWNDVPYGQIPCSLRSTYDFVDDDKMSHMIHSSFECNSKGTYKSGTFRELVKIKYRYLNTSEFNDILKGLPLSYCFKSLHNEFEDKKNQVHTRALHAEENAMLQMSRFGGEGLENGIIYVTASPCELCCKKLYQIGVRKIVYIDEYPGISRQNIIEAGFKRPQLKQYQGAYGTTYFKLYQPVMPYKEELELRLKSCLTKHTPKPEPSPNDNDLDANFTSWINKVNDPDILKEVIEKISVRLESIARSSKEANG